MEDDAYKSHSSTTIDNTSIVIVSMLLDEDRWMMVQEIEHVSGIPKNHDTLHFNRTSPEQKVCDVVGTIHAVSHVKTTLYWTLSETFDSLPKRRNWIFAGIISTSAVDF